jgi:hypothetical protein
MYVPRSKLKLKLTLRVPGERAKTEFAVAAGGRLGDGNDSMWIPVTQCTAATEALSVISAWMPRVLQSMDFGVGEKRRRIGEGF